MLNREFRYPAGQFLLSVPAGLIDPADKGVLLPDKPGELVRVASVIADKKGNVIKLDHNQFVSTNRSAAVELKITIEAFGTEHKNEIIEALEEEVR